MQPPTDGPRSTYTLEQVAYLLEQTSSVEVSVGLELLDVTDLSVVDDLTDTLSGGSVTRSSYANIHGSAQFLLSQPLDWGSSIVRPYYLLTGPISSLPTVSAVPSSTYLDQYADTYTAFAAAAATDGMTTMRFNLGAYFLHTPDTDLSTSPPTYDVAGYDILSILDDAIGDAYSIPAGVAYLDRVADILTARGVTQYVIDQDAIGSVLQSAKVYTMDNNVTWLTVVNDLLAAVGYQGIWSDWNGYLRCQAYTTPSDRAPEWVLGVDDATNIIGQAVKRSHDFYDAPNRWVFYRANNTDDVAPVDGAGRYEFINVNVGETSQERRAGVTRTKVVSLDAADQAGLVAAAQQTIDADMQTPTKFSFPLAPFPLAWHFDKLTIADPRFGAVQDVLGSSWTLPFDGSDMGYEATVIPR